VAKAQKRGPLGPKSPKLRGGIVREANRLLFFFNFDWDFLIFYGLLFFLFVKPTIVNNGHNGKAIIPIIKPRF
jgi:hypothetical protein